MRRPQRLTGTLPAPTRTGWKRFVPSKRRVQVFLATFIAVWMLGSGAAMAVDMHASTTPATVRVTAADCLDNHSCKPTKTVQPGELIPIRDMSKGGNKTLFESYDLTHWQIGYDQENAVRDAGNRLMLDLVNTLLFVLVLVVYMTIGLAWWLFGATNVPGLSDASADLIGGASGAMLTWVFPTAVAVGAIIAYIQGRQAKGSWFGQIAWMVFAGVFAVGLTTSPGVFTNGIEQVRETGSNVVLDTSNQALDGDAQYPLSWNKVDYSVNTSKDAMLRKTGDAIWRDFVATPWCLAQFGSISACQKYGPAMLKSEPTNDARSDVIKNTVYKTEGNGNNQAGKDSETGQWTKGSTWWLQLVIVLIALVAAIVFCALMLVLGFSALSAVIMTTLLLIAGVFFAALWIIPGPTRQWGVAWAEALVGSIMVTFLALITFSVVIVATAAIFIASASAGWFVSLGTIIVMLLTAFAFRSRLLQIVGTQGSGIGRTFLAGAALTGMATRALGRVRGAGAAASAGRAAARGGQQGNALQRGLGRARTTANRANQAMQKGAAWRMRGLQQRAAASTAGAGEAAESAAGVVPNPGSSRRPVRFESSNDGNRVLRRSRQAGPTFSPADRGTSRRVLASRSYTSRTGKQPYAATRTPRTPGVRTASSTQRQREAFQFRPPPRPQPTQPQPVPRPGASRAVPQQQPAARPQRASVSAGAAPRRTPAPVTRTPIAGRPRRTDDGKR
ncbi:type IV secretion system protein [Curtobacterium flaccumfaciens]|uniref:type IV secretion system protein n=1 Tax=Curtobacterium flaccumfaciens TaxID=2035 RepID=UPI001E5B44C3|nr:type IV secretion system protein [Curtobacterium allii]MCE0459516.1 type IV secretion system protein [Curtobacterium allii]